MARIFERPELMCVRKPSFRLVKLFVAVLTIATSSSTLAVARTCELGPDRLVVADGYAPLGLEKAAFLTDEVKGLFEGDAISADPLCSRKLSFVIKPSDENFTDDNGKQEFSIHRDEKKIIITAATTIGAVYGFYEVLERLGFRFLSPQVTIKPAVLDWGLVPAAFSLTPKIPSRGFWVFGDNLNAEFLLWAGRNRFNLVGGSFDDPRNYRSIFEIAEWAGGHDVISRLTPTDQPVRGEMLLEKHRDWFGGGAKPESIAFAKDSYKNPCFGDETYADYFAKTLLNEILDGQYNGSDILNVWPSDSPAVVVDATCEHASNAKNGNDDLSAFYARVTAMMRAAAKTAGAKLPLISGISYYGTYDLRNLSIKLPTDPNYLHIFYNNVRSYKVGYFDKIAPLNATMSDAYEAGLRGNPGLKFGVVDYHNYSIYSGMLFANTAMFGGELNRFAADGAQLYAWMHPAINPSVSEMLVNRTISRTLFGSDSGANILKDFQTKYFDGNQQLVEAMALYTDALSYRAEIFGPDQSLTTVLLNDFYWAKPLLSEAQTAQFLKGYITGVPIELPKMRLAFLPPLKTDGVNIQSITDELQKSTSLAASVAEKMTGDLQSRARDMSIEFERVGLMHEKLLRFAEAKLLHIEGDNAGCRVKLNAAEALQLRLNTLPWPVYVSGDNVSKMSMQKRYETVHGQIMTFFKTKICP